VAHFQLSCINHMKYIAFTLTAVTCLVSSFHGSQTPRLPTCYLPASCPSKTNPSSPNHHQLICNREKDINHQLSSFMFLSHLFLTCYLQLRFICTIKLIKLTILSVSYVNPDNHILWEAFIFFFFFSFFCGFITRKNILYGSYMRQNM